MKRILNFGSLNIDYVYQMEHFVRPGETAHSKRLKCNCGGKGLNQSIALTRAGATVFHAGCVGEDGQMLLNELSGAGVEIANIRTVTERSGNAIIQVNEKGENAIILFGGANQCISEEQVQTVLAQFDREDVLLLQNEINCTGRLIERASEMGMTIVLNPSPCDERIGKLPLHLVDLFVLNEIEGRDIVNGGEMESTAIMAALRERFPAAKIVLTLGPQGAIYYDGINEYFQKAFPVQAVDTTAAGDTFTGFFLAGYAAGEPSAQLLEAAARASALTVSRAGAAGSIPTAEEVREAVLAEG